NNTSWRFVVADYVFPVPTNPWLQSWPETITLANLLEDVLDADFVGVKIGDLDGSAESNAQEPAYERELAGLYNLEAEDIILEAGATYTVPIRANLQEIDALQGTMKLKSVELLGLEYGQMTEGNFGHRFINQGYLTFSWGCKDALQCVSTTDNALFSLLIRAEQNILLSEALSINSRYTSAEAYAMPTAQREAQVFGLGIQFREGQTPAEATRMDGVQLYQNVPNPFVAESTIRFYLPKTSPATLTIMDVSGKTIVEISGSYPAGYQTMTITEEMLNGVSGVYYYSLQVGDDLRTRKMVILAK
ncbi:MAG: T9SS type A sorting domain-containing protein, partial [Bacteroidota bacterium]